MKKKIIVLLASFLLVLNVTACNSSNENISESSEENTNNVMETSSSEEQDAEKNGVNDFSAECVVEGKTSSGEPKTDTYIFKGKTEDSIITDLDFDIIENKGTDKELSKKDIYGYQMNISDAEVKKENDGYKLVKLTATGYDDAFEDGQYMITSSSDLIDDDTKFGDLKFANMYSEDELDINKAIEGFKYVAKEAGIESLTAETPLKDIISKYDLYKEGSFVEGNKRISFAGYNGGRSFGEQIDAIVKYILDEKMTLEEVYDMFKTVNQIDTPIKERDAVSGATIAFVGDFQKVVEIAMNGKLKEQVITDKTLDNKNVLVEVLTQGYGGEIITDVTFNEEGKIIDIEVKDSNESEDIGALLTEKNSDFIKSLIEGQDNLDKVESVSGATVTSNALIKAIDLAKEHFDTLNK